MGLNTGRGRLGVLRGTSTEVEQGSSSLFDVDRRPSSFPSYLTRRVDRQRFTITGKVSSSAGLPSCPSRRELQTLQPSWLGQKKRLYDPLLLSLYGSCDLRTASLSSGKVSSSAGRRGLPLAPAIRRRNKSLERS